MRGVVQVACGEPLKVDLHTQLDDALVAGGREGAEIAVDLAPSSVKPRSRYIQEATEGYKAFRYVAFCGRG